MGWRTEYTNTVEVEDNDGEVHQLSIRYVTWETRSTRTDPGDYEEDEYELELDGKPYAESELPKWITSAIIDDARATTTGRSYSPDRGYD